MNWRSIICKITGHFDAHVVRYFAYDRICSRCGRSFVGW